MMAVRMRNVEGVKGFPWGWVGPGIFQRLSGFKNPIRILAADPAERGGDSLTARGFAGAESEWGWFNRPRMREWEEPRSKRGSPMDSLCGMIDSVRALTVRS
jgi:hypothetical protein